MPKGYHHVTREQRAQIYIPVLYHHTLCRELKNNTGKRGYRFKQADDKARDRRLRQSQLPKKMTTEMLDFT